MNRIQLIGRLTKDVEMLKSKTGTEVGKITLAVARPRQKDKEREVDFIDCVAFGTLGETLAKYIEKGNRIYVEGSLNINKYEDKEGNTRYSTSVIISSFEFIDFKKTDNVEGQEEIPNV